MINWTKAWLKKQKTKRWLRKYHKKPKHCIDPVMKYCQGCRYGYCHYPDDVETYKDLEGCSFESGCSLGLEDTQPTKRELRKFNKMCNKLYKPCKSPFKDNDYD